MSTAVEVVNPPNLAELADRINRTLDATDVAFKTSLDHAIAAGKLLIEAQQIVPYGEWKRWVGANIKTFHSRSPEGVWNTACTYMRLARNSELVLSMGYKNIEQARLALTSHPETIHARGLAYERADHKAVKRLRAEGVSKRRISHTLGIPEKTVYRILDPEGQRRKNREKANRENRAKRALRKQEQADSVARAGGGIAEGYSLIRRALQVLDAAISETADVDAKRAINSAIGKLHAAEDSIAAAVKGS